MAAAAGGKQPARAPSDDAGAGSTAPGSTAGSLAERLRELKLREASDADAAAVQRAQQAKATLSERMKDLLANGPVADDVAEDMASRAEARSFEALALRAEPAPTVAEPGPPRPG